MNRDKRFALRVISTSEEPVCQVLLSGLGINHHLRRRFEEIRRIVYCDDKKWEFRNRERTLVDDTAIYIAAFERGRAVAGCRISIALHPRDTLPMFERQEFLDLVEPPCVEIGRMVILSNRIRNAGTIVGLYRNIFAALHTGEQWSGIRLPAYATVQPEYRARLNEHFPAKEEIFVRIGESIIAKTGTGKEIEHELMLIDTERWERWYKEADAMECENSSVA